MKYAYQAHYLKVEQIDSPRSLKCKKIKYLLGKFIAN